jgi:hypothetical protein
MKITKKQLKQIIKEELSNLEEWSPAPEGSMDDLRQGDVIMSVVDHAVDDDENPQTDKTKIKKGEKWMVAKNPVSKFSKIFIKKGAGKGRIASLFSRTATDFREYWRKV